METFPHHATLIGILSKKVKYFDAKGLNGQDFSGRCY
ncbi:MAG: hypothetical protein RJB13_2095 [Pseudomonadota bacterium]